MSENERQVYAELLSNVDALDALYTEFVGKIITPALTAQDKADAIRAAFTQQRENAIESAFGDYGMNPEDVRRLF
jgi:hypothetical protein